MSKNELSSKVEQQFPEFVREENPGAIAFLEAYYTWLENDFGSISPMDLRSVYDLDQSMEEFVDHFRAQYLLNFPKSLAENADGQAVNEKNLIKNIKDFYLAKGSEISYKLLFRILYDVNVETYLPKTDILVASGGNFVQQTSIRVTNLLGKDIYKAIGQQVTQVNQNTQQVLGYARCERVVRFREGNYDIAELFLADIQGSFDNGFSIQFTKDDVIYKEEDTYSVVSGITIDSEGLGHIVGERVTISSPTGVGAIGEVSRVGLNGEVKKVRMINFGARYNTPGDITVTFEETTAEQESLTPVSATGTAQTGGLCQYEGFYSDNSGHISSNKVLQDNIYYQHYSYVLKSEIVISRYKEFVKNLIHPAGMAFFGAVDIQRCFQQFIGTSNSINTILLPYIGNYTPYTFRTNESLDDNYPFGYYSDTAGATLATPGHPDGFPFWSILAHPDVNTRFKDIVIRDFINMPGGYSHECSDDLG